MALTVGTKGSLQGGPASSDAQLTSASDECTPVGKPKAAAPEYSQQKRPAPTPILNQYAAKKVRTFVAHSTQNVEDTLNRPDMKDPLQQIRAELDAKKQQANEEGRPHMVQIPDTNHSIWVPPTAGCHVANPWVESKEEAAKRVPVLKYIDHLGGVRYAFDDDWERYLVRRGDLFQKRTA